MRNIIIPFTVFFLFFFSNCRKEEMFNKPHDLKCEYMSNPLGIGEATPRFSWKLGDTTRGAMQTAYQLMVATSRPQLDREKPDIWNTGKVSSGRSVLVEYEGPPVGSSTKYFWKVRSWNKDSVPSDWSDPAWFETGLLKENDWKADWISGQPVESPGLTESFGYWIWHPGGSYPNRNVCFRKKFTLDPGKKPKEVVLSLSADNEYVAWINGHYIARSRNWKQIREHCLIGRIRPGGNVLAVSAKHMGDDRGGLIFNLRILYEDGSEEVIISDAGCPVTLDPEDSWKNPDYKESGFVNAREIAPYGKGPRQKQAVKDFRPRSLMMRKTFTVDRKVKKARLYVSGLGNYVMSINGERAGEDVLTPGWTNYPEKVQYQTYDITSMLRQGKNVAGAILGNMWWSSGLGWSGGVTYSTDPNRLIAQIIIEYNNGGEKILATDDSWKIHPSPILKNSLYDGETYDARLEQAGWDSTGFNDSRWENARIVTDVHVKLVAQQGPPLRVTEQLIPVNITRTEFNTYVFDFGQNMVGWTRLKVRGKAGNRIQLKYAELLHEDGTVAQENLRTALATDYYILKGEETEIWEPKFTYHGFRYVEVAGLPEPPSSETLTGLVVHSDAPFTGEFVCSSDLLNGIWQNILWSQRGNMHSVPTDCPQRDERLGWMGDAQIFTPTACYNMHMAGFLSKWEKDITDCQEEEGWVYDVNPAIVVEGPSKPGWGDAVVIIPWTVYRFYGDEKILEENYEGMKAWVEYMRKESRNDIYRWGTEEWDGYGDWIAVVESPAFPISAAYYYYSTKLLSGIAGILGHHKDEKDYAELADRIAEAFNERFLDKNTYNYPAGTQTANLLPVAFGITPEPLQDEVVRNIMTDVKARGYHPATGFLGTAYLLPVLSDFGYHKAAFKTATGMEYPSWGYMLEKGATTIWELWNSDTEPPGGMNSRNHFALGSVGEWYYSHLAGIRTDDEQPGFKHTVIAPCPVKELAWARALIDTDYGLLASSWEQEEKEYRLKVTIPPNTRATVKIPLLEYTSPLITEGQSVLLKEGNPVEKSENISFRGMENNRAVFLTGSGNYHFVLTQE